MKSRFIGAILYLVLLFASNPWPYEAEPIDVYILTGQSNALGTTRGEGAAAADYGPGIDAIDREILFYWSNVHSGNSSYPPKLYGDSSKAITHLQMQQGDGLNNPAFWGVEFGFGRSIAKQGGRKICIIKATRGGGGSSYWDPEIYQRNHDSGHMWKHVTDTVDGALQQLTSQGATFRLRGLIYIQGESNGMDEARAAAGRLAAFISGLRHHITKHHAVDASGMPVVVVEIADPDGKASRQTTVIQHRQFADWHHGVAFVKTRDLALQADGIHFANKSKHVIGERVAEALRALDRTKAERTDDLKILRGDVLRVAVAGTPGSVEAVGPTAFPLVLGSANGRRASVAAAGRLSRGRVVAFGHTGFVTDALEGDTQVLLKQSLQWASGKQSEIRVGLLQPGPLPAWLKDFAHQVVPISSRNLPEKIGEVDVVFGLARLLEGHEERVLDFVERGGGLVLAETGWGWMQTRKDAVLSEHPAQGVLSRAGLLIADRFVDAASLKLATEEDWDRTAFAGMGRVIALSGDPRAGADASTALASAIRCSPAQTPWIESIESLVSAADRPLPRPHAPIDLRDPRTAAIVTLEARELDRMAVDAGQAHPAAAFFPGGVPDDAVRVSKELKIEPAQMGWQSTGLYAQAGELITLSVPAGFTNGQLQLRIGCHTDSIAHHDKWSRMPQISRAWVVDREEMRVSSPFGGLVYLEWLRPVVGGEKVRVRVDGAVASPYFKLGETDLIQWREQIRHAPAPWAELASDKVILSVPSEHVRQLENPDELMAFWDRVSDAQADLATIPRERDRPHRFVSDVQISAGYMHAGYPIMTHLDAAPRMASLDVMRKGDWGLFHELGHNHQESAWTFTGTVEVTCNLFTLYTFEKVCDPSDQAPHPGVSKPSQARQIKAHQAEGRPFDRWQADPFRGLVMYQQLQVAFGWETYQKVFEQYRALPASERPRSDDDKRDRWMVMFSKASGHDLGPFFEYWGVPIRESARQSVRGLPVWMPAME